jgi:hypothetical protein
LRYHWKIMEPKAQISDALAAFTGTPLKEAAVALFDKLGYVSNRTLAIDSLADLQERLDTNGLLNENNALLSRWRNVHLLFQLTPDELIRNSQQALLLDDASDLDLKIVKSYVFFALELSGNTPSRSELSLITRALNRLIPLPVLVLFKHGDAVSLAIVNRRRNMRDGTRDVLTRVSFIRNIDCRNSHRAHLDLLARFALSSLSEERGVIKTFAQLDDAWQKLLSTKELNEQFYRELVDWFTWATGEIRLARLPDHVSDTPNHRKLATQEFTVRMICRLIFAWFLKEMGLIPKELLELYDAANRPRNLTAGPENRRQFLGGNQYYRGILQNIFFQALNRPMNQRRKSGPEAANDRTVTSPELKKLAYLGKNQLPEKFDYDLFDRIPYLNGGLFDKLDEDNASDTIEDDVFRVPNKLFYAGREDGFTIPVGNRKKIVNRPVEGLNRIFDRYRFTVAENTPLEEDVALDPELLGLVFENLLAEIDPTDEAAAETARKASGSYYTPRRIVDYMVNEALHLHVRTEFEKQNASSADFRLLSHLFYEPADGTDFEPIADRAVDALDAVRVLDPACGSGAFPMGMLHRMVELLGRLDPENKLWLARMLSRIPAAARQAFEHELAGKSYAYVRKLGLIQNNLYGVDIQPLAALIAKLRFFLTLVIEQDVDAADRSRNYGLQPLPNLETNLLCANTLVDGEHGMISDLILARLRECREAYYQPQTTREEREELASEIGQQLATLFPGFAEATKGVKPEGPTKIDRQNMRRQQDSYWLAEWFKHAVVAAPFFNVETFFPELVGDGDSRNPAPFHIVIGNPPYGGTKIPDPLKKTLGLGSKDPYGAFIARFIGDPRRPTPLADGGVLAYIVSDTFMTIKTHRPLRDQMMQNRIHKMLRVSGDTFKATVNCAIILCQRGTAPQDQTCQMADLTNVSIWTQHERFLHLLYQTEGFARRQNVSNQTYAIYHYRQSLIATNTNLPFFVASPKIFALMNDTTAPVTHEEIGGKRVPIHTAQMNGKLIALVKFSAIAEVRQGLGTGETKAYLFQNPTARGSYRSIEELHNFLLTDADLERIYSDDKLRHQVIHSGISKDNQKSPRFFGGRYIMPYDKGGESDSGDGWMPKYSVPTEYFIDWSEWAVNRIKTLTIRERDGTGPNKVCSRFQNSEFYFMPGITFSHTGIYSPTFRRGSATVFDMAGSTLFCECMRVDELLLRLNSKVWIYLFKNFANASVNASEDPIKEIPLPQPSKQLDPTGLIQGLVRHQIDAPRYDYASNEQIEIDRLVYEAYGLNEADIREVEDWYARRYPKLAKAQRRALAAKQGRTEEDLIDRPVIHLYCDESRHLPKDREPCLLMGLVAAPASAARDLNHALSELWKTRGLPLHFEAKWTKVSPARLDFYRALVEWFFAQEALSFRAMILPDKQSLYAALPEESRDHLYYRLYYQFLRAAVEPENRYRAFLDLKDTRGREKIGELKNILKADADDETAIRSLQHIHSHEVRLAQINDLLLGAVGFARRPRTEKDSRAKLALVELIGEKAGFPLGEDSPPGAEKVVLSTWHDKDALLL